MDQILLLYENDYKSIKTDLNELKEACRARLIFMADQSGQVISSVGEITNLDLPTLTSLTAGAFAANLRVGEILGGEKFITLTSEGGMASLQLSLVRDRFILGVVFDTRTTLGLIRLKMTKAVKQLEEIFDGIIDKIEKEKQTFGGMESPFPEITEEDIDKLFGDL